MLDGAGVEFACGAEGGDGVRPCAVVEGGADDTSEMTFVLTFGDGWSDFGVAACKSAPHRIGGFGGN